MAILVMSVQRRNKHYQQQSKHSQHHIFLTSSRRDREAIVASCFGTQMLTSELAGVVKYLIAWGQGVDHDPERALW